MDSKTSDPALDMVMQVKVKTGLPFETLIRLAFAYDRQTHPESFLKEAATQLVNHNVIPEALYDFCIDYMAHRITTRLGENPSNGKKMVWVVKL